MDGVRVLTPVDRLECHAPTRVTSGPEAHHLQKECENMKIEEERERRIKEDRGGDRRRVEKRE